ncbi:MAG: hypothetical protein IKP24_01670 [Alphaproteobacteria bacterium]|nr:hypothetical protein [Alphaproteobacteria bacterium]
MSATNCPYDGDFCQKKDAKFNAWQKVVIQSDGMVFKINPDMFAGCAIDSEEERKKICDRYQRYLFITNNIKHER